MRKRVLAGILSAAIALSLPMGAVMPQSASAKEANDAAKSAVVSKQKDSTKKESKVNVKEDYVEGDAIVVYKKGGSVRSKKAAKKAAIGIRDDIRVLGSYEFSDNVAKKSALRKTSVNNSQGFFVQKVHSDKLSTKELIAELEKDASVAYAEPNYKIKTAGLTDDTYSDYQWSLQNNKLNDSKENADIQPEKAWAAATTATKEAVIAVVDSGIDYTHEDLKDVMWQNPYKPSQLAGTYGYDFINQDDDPFDDNGHGSHCAGIIAASPDNKAGISGVSRGGVKLMALKVLAGEGWGDVFSFLGAYYYMLKAKSLGTNIIAANNSWGGNTEIRSFKDALKLAGEEGIISVMASGNNSCNLDKTFKAPNGNYLENSVVVGASDEWDDKAGFSNYGVESVDIGAPGTDILSTVSYDCLNPTIYTEQQRANLLSGYYDGENFSGSAIQSITVTDASGKDVTSRILKISSDNFFGKSGKATMFDFKGAKKGDTYTISIPYKTGYSDTPIFGSMMLNTNGPEGYNDDKVDTDDPEAEYKANRVEFYHSVLKYNAAQDKVYEEEPEFIRTLVLANKGHYWRHDHKELISAYDAKSSAVGGIFRANVTINTDSASCFYLDDLAVSKEGVDSSAFGKYDFYNGTSMAAPTVTGAVALLYRQGDKPETVLSKVFSCVRKSDAWKDKCRTGGVLDLSKVEEYLPVIRRVEENDKIQTVLSGYNFGNDKGSIKIDNAALPADKILSWNDKQVTVDLSAYRYKTVSIELMNTKGYTVSNSYCLKNTKDKLHKVAELNFPLEFLNPSIVTDGTQLYTYSDGIIKSISTKTGELQDIFTFNIDMVKPYLNDYDTSRVEIDYLPGSVYGADSIWALADVTNTYRDINLLLRYNFKTKKAESYIVQEGSYDMMNTPVMAFYRNSIYLIGGVDNQSVDMKQVIRYDISLKSWEKEKDLPTGIADGNAVVNGDKLYLLGKGYFENKNVVLLCFDGTTWKKLPSKLDSLDNGEYAACSAMGVAKDKLILIGNGSQEFGTVMAYNLKTGSLESTGYSTGLPVDSFVMGSVTIGNTCYFIANDVREVRISETGNMQYVNLYSMPVEGVSKPAPAVKEDVKVKKITITTSTKKKTVRYGEKLTLKAVVTPNNAAKKDVTWTIDKKSYASISAKGVLTPKKAGIGKSVVVKAAAKDGSKVTAKIKISILDKSKKK